MESKLDKFFLVLVFFLIIGLSLGYSSFFLCLAALLLRICTSDKHSIGIFLLMYGGIMGGAIRLMYPFIPIYGLMLNFIGIILLWNIIRGLFNEDKMSSIYMLLVFAYFGVSYLLGPKSEFAATKYSKMIENGIFMLFGYYALFKSTVFSPTKLSQILLLTTISIFSFDINFYHMTPGGLFDFNWFRQQEMAYFYANDKIGYLASYQELGVLALLSFTIFVAQTGIKLRQVAPYALFATLLILTSSARQAIFGLFIVLILRYSIFNERNLKQENPIIKIIISVIIIYILLNLVEYVLPLLNIDVINTTLQSGDETRTLLYLESIQMFLSNPITGLGLGGFEAHTMSDQPWPHNIILELLCECGIAGLVILCLLLVTYFRNNKISLLILNNRQMFFFLIVSANIVSYMVSADFRLSISVFSSLLAAQSIKLQNN